ncbi:MAG TPA: hypothetical protein DCW74_02205 [Alteromonas australica]|uniref:Helix-turn-helix domain-containing protein n=1 Tax=Alteromonas australica TaxID=589873 RepID=A0A350NZR2_9ALTE|nr:hypothetical protein [Alteromonas australica]
MAVDKSLQEIAAELKGIRNILASIWHSRYSDGKTDQVSPEIYADEYISTAECSKRLGITDQTIRNWIIQGKKKGARPGPGCWIQGIHYVTVPMGTRKQIVRIPWNQLIMSFHKGEKLSLRAFDSPHGKHLYEEDLTRREGT